MNFIIINADVINEKKTLKNVFGGILSEVVTALAVTKKTQQVVEKISEEFSIMSISELRRKAHKRGLDVDGTREMLISALEIGGSNGDLDDISSEDDANDESDDEESRNDESEDEDVDNEDSDND